jgi:hypothetical protein
MWPPASKSNGENMNPKSNAAASPHLAREAKMPSEQDRGVKASKPTRRILIFVMAMATSASSATSYAQSILGSSGAGFQTWTAADLNNNEAPYWDAVTENYLGDPTNKNVGFCLMGTGDCVGILTSVFVPGPIPFWGMTYNSAGDALGANRSPGLFQARWGAPQNHSATSVVEQID